MEQPNIIYGHYTSLFAASYLKPWRLVKRIELTEDQCFLWDTAVCLFVPSTELTVTTSLLHFTVHETLKGEEKCLSVTLVHAFRKHTPLIFTHISEKL